MNASYAQQAEEHARRNPHDPHAQALYAHWIRGMMQVNMMHTQASTNAQTNIMHGPAQGQSAPGTAPLSGAGAAAPAQTVPAPAASSEATRVPSFHHPRLYSDGVT